MATVTFSPELPLSPDDASFEPVPGMRLGSYELVRRIASGGMAQVWAAERSGEFGFRRACAVKVIRPEYASSSTFRRMFLDEARLASRIHHPHVVEVFDLGEAGPIVYQAMELVKGCTLAQMLARLSQLEPGLACRIVADMARGLHAAHELTDEGGVPLGLVHRDVSPQNILISIDGMAKIADFGIAKAIGRVAEETDAGQLKGKLSYLSPEQAERKRIDRRSDVFASGIVLWEALSGRRLFRGDDAVDTLARVRETVVPDLREIAPVPGPIVQVVNRALERSPERRYATAAELSDALEAAALEARVYLTTQQLAAVVSELAAPEKNRTSAGYRMAAPTTPDTHGGMSGEASRSSATRVALWSALALAVALATGAAAVLLTHKADGVAAGVTADLATATATAAVAATASAVATATATVPLTSADAAVARAPMPVPSATSPVPAVRRGRQAAPAGRRNGNAAAQPGAPRLPFDNPY